jgi:hypothetical protein
MQTLNACALPTAPHFCMLPGQVAILAFAWKCECKKPMQFDREEFVRGMGALGCVWHLGQTRSSLLFPQFEVSCRELRVSLSFLPTGWDGG